IAQALQLLVHVGHEAVEVPAELLPERQARVEEVEQQRLAAADAAPQIQPPDGLDRPSGEPRELTLQQPLVPAPLHELAVQPLERLRRAALRLVRRELAAREPALVLRERARHVASSGRSRNSSSAAGFASASRFLTGRPWITSRTASSTSLPFSVRGISVTGRIFAGTCRGLACRRSRSRMRSQSAASSAWPGCSL